jgi:hypothetical protein
MAIDERLEALTQSVELTASLQQDVEREQKKTTVEIRELARVVRAIVLRGNDAANTDIKR